MKTALSAISRFVDRRQAFFFPAPAVAVLFLIIVLPIAFNLYLTFTKCTVGLGQPRFIGFDNFGEAFGGERARNAGRGELLLAPRGGAARGPVGQQFAEGSPDPGDG